MAADAGDASILRAKYLDWCSARIADRFLRLPPEEIYELAHEVARDRSGRIDREVLTVLSLLGIGPVSPRRGAAGDVGGVSSSGDARGADAGPEVGPGAGSASGGKSYRELVAKVAERLAARMDLPAFEEWSQAYRAAPERYDREMLGFWRG